MMKVIIIILTLTTLAALALVLFSLPAQQAANLSPLFNLADYSELIFLAAFLGWMPAPMDISVWHSVWSEEANRSSGKRLAMDKAMLDFKVGFFGTALLAMAFLTLGALLMFGSGETPSANGAVFASQLIKLYTDALGEWAYPLIGIAALATMFSTTLTCLDAYPRTLEESYFIWRGQSGYGTRAGTSSRLYRTLLVVAVLGTIGIFLIVKNHAGAMGLVVTTATVVSFISAPLIAYINFRVMRGNTLPEADRPNRLMQIWSWLGILLMAVFSVAYIGLIMR